MDKLLEILNELKPNVDFTKEISLIDSGILDSLTLMELVAALEDAYDIDISVLEIVPENFQSAGAIYDMVCRIQDDL